MKERAYHEQVNIKNEVQLRSQLDALPEFCKEYFIELLFCIIAEAVPECRDEADVSVGADHERAYG